MESQERLLEQVTAHKSRRYLLKQKGLSLAVEYSIRDVICGPVYRIRGKVLSAGQTLSFQDMEGNELQILKKEPLHVPPTWQILRGGGLVATLKRQVFGGSPQSITFTIRTPLSDDLIAAGDFPYRKYVCTRGDQVVATVSNHWWKTGEDFDSVEVSEGEDDLLILACAVVIDMECDRG